MTVIEKIHRNRFGRYMYRRGWRAVTLPNLRGGITVRYWVCAGIETVIHENSIHVPQIRELGRLRYLYTYARLWLEGYRIAREMGDTRKSAAQHAYESHPMESEDWRDRLVQTMCFCCQTERCAYCDAYWRSVA